MSERDYAPLSIACVRGLCDKIYEKRKFAGVEIEKMVKDFSDANNTNQLKRLIRVLGQDLMSSTNPNVKNGALMGLSSVAVGLGKGCVSYLPELLLPILACSSEGESRVRYQAAEALFNVLKIARGASLAHFPAVFDALARLAADPEPAVKQGAELLDRLLKDIVTESPSFEVGQFIPQLRGRMYARGAGARQLAVSWLAALHAVPGLDLLPRLPQLLDPLVLLLADPSPELRRMCDVQLNEFLRSIKKDPARVDFAAMVNILITHAQSPEELLQLTAVRWLKEFVELAGLALRPAAPGLLAAALPCLAYADDQRRNIRETAAIVNFQLSKLIVSETETEAEAGAEAGAEAEAESTDTESKPSLPLAEMVDVLTQMLHHSSVHTKGAALDWLLTLYHKLPTQMSPLTAGVFVSVVGSLTDHSDDVVRRALAVIAEICSASASTAAAAVDPSASASAAASDADLAPAAADGEPTTPRPGELASSPYYYKFLEALLRLLAADENLLEDRGAFIIRQLCVLLNAEEVYGALSAILRRERRLRFAATVVGVLSTLLLTAAELYDLRHHLRARGQGSRSLFLQLYRCWSHSPVSLLALCLLTHHYEHCNTLINTFGDLEITVDFLTEIDKLVQLIESPIFAYLRLELLGGESAALRAALYGLLMLLPQCDAFHALRRRLQCAPHCATAPPPGAEQDPELAELLQQFVSLQAEHRRYRALDRPRPAPPAYS